MISIINLLTGVLTTKSGRLTGLIVLIVSVLLFVFAIKHKRERFTKIPAISLLEKVKYMDQLDVATFHTNEILLLGDPDVLEKMIEKSVADSLDAFSKRAILIQKIELAKLDILSIHNHQKVFEENLVTLQKQMDQAYEKFKNLDEDINRYIKKLDQMTTQQVSLSFGSEIVNAWNNYKRASKNDAEERKEAKSNMSKVWIQQKKERLNQWSLLKKQYHEKERGLKSSTNQKKLKKLMESQKKLNESLDKTNLNLSSTRAKIEQLQKNLIKTKSSYKNELNVKNPRLLAILSAKVPMYIDLKKITTAISEDSTITIGIESIKYAPVEVNLDSSKHYNVAKRNLEVKSSYNGLYTEIFEQLQESIEVIEKRVLQKAKAKSIVTNAQKKTRDYFQNSLGPLGYKVEVKFGIPSEKQEDHKKREIYKTNHKQTDDKSFSNTTTKAESTYSVSTAKNNVIDTLKGIDVSHYNGDITWKNVASHGIHFAYAKATQGTTYTDPKFAINWNAIKKVSIQRGAYHFYSPTEDPSEQAKHFIAVLGKLNKDDLPPMLDLEGSNIEGVSKSSYQQNVLRWLEKVESHYGIQPIIYTNNAFGNEYLDLNTFSKYKLWIAEYTEAPEPHVPVAWKKNGWYTWQQSSANKIAGITGYVDLNYHIKRREE